MEVLISPDGSIRAIQAAPLRSVLHAIGDVSTARASHVVPLNRILRWAFVAIRSRVADDSFLAGLTRRWRCAWLADLGPVRGPVLGPFRTREAALAAEAGYLVEQQVPLPTTLQGGRT